MGCHKKISPIVEKGRKRFVEAECARRKVHSASDLRELSITMLVSSIIVINEGIIVADAKLLEALGRRSQDARFTPNLV